MAFPVKTTASMIAMLATGANAMVLPPHSFQTSAALNLLQLDAIQMQDQNKAKGLPPIKPDPSQAVWSIGTESHIPDFLAEKLIRIAWLVQSVTKIGLDEATLAAVSPTADRDHMIAHNMKEKLEKREKVALDDIMGLVELLSKSQTAESAAANDVLITAHDISMMMGGFKGEDYGSNYNYDDDHKNFATYQGDLLSNSDNAPWKNSNVKYCFAEDISPRVKKSFKVAAKRFSRAVPCLRFEEIAWESGKSDSIREYMKCEEHPAIFVTSNPAYGCFSHLGMVQQGTSQQLQLNDPGCALIGTVMHELGHALGLGHAHPDASTEILTNKVAHGRGKNFEFEASAEANKWNNSLSIMHFDAYAFAEDPKQATMDGPDVAMLGQRVGLSIADVASLSLIYRHQSAECIRSGLAGLGSVENFTIQCYQGTDCPGKELFEVNSTNDTDDEDGVSADDQRKHGPNVWDKIKGFVR